MRRQAALALRIALSLNDASAILHDHQDNESQVNQQRYRGHEDDDRTTGEGTSPTWANERTDCITAITTTEQR